MSAISTPGGGTPGSPGAPGATGPLRGLANNAALKTTSVPSAGDAVSTASAVSAGDFGDGIFKWVSGTRPTEDGIFVIYHNTDTSGYFYRKWDGRNVNMAWAGLAASATSASIQTFLNLCAGKTISVDKFYTGLTAALTLPDGTSLVGDIPGVGFKGDGTVRTLINQGVKSVVANLLLDGGVTSLTRNNNFELFGIVQLNTGSKVRDCTLQNAPRCCIAGYNVKGCRVRDNTIIGSQWYAVFTQRCSDLKVIGNQLSGLLNDGIKIHSKDSVVTNGSISDIYVNQNRIDYTGQTLTGDTLAIELWGGQTSTNYRPRVLENEVIGPDNQTAGSFWCISMDSVTSGTVENNGADGGIKGAYIGIECAGCQHLTISKNRIRRHSSLGISVSQANSRRVRIVENDIRESVGFANVYGIQLLDGIKYVLIEGNTFKDAGARFIFFNTAGSYSFIQHNHFFASQATGRATAIYVNAGGVGGVTGLNISDNYFGPLVEPGDTATANNLNAIDGGQMTNSTVARNTVDGTIPSSGAAGPADISCYSGGGNNLYEGNRGINLTGNLVGAYDGGTACVFTNNFGGVSARTGAVTDLLYGKNSA